MARHMLLLALLGGASWRQVRPTCKQARLHSVDKSAHERSGYAGLRSMPFCRGSGDVRAFARVCKPVLLHAVCVRCVRALCACAVFALCAYARLRVCLCICVVVRAAVRALLRLSVHMSASACACALVRVRARAHVLVRVCVYVRVRV